VYELIGYDIHDIQSKLLFWEWIMKGGWVARFHGTAIPRGREAASKEVDLYALFGHAPRIPRQSLQEMRVYRAAAKGCREKGELSCSSLTH